MTKVQFGLSNLYVAERVDTEGTITYKTPVKVNGAKSLSLEQQGDSEVFYADNIAYFTSSISSGYEGDLEIADLPKNFLTDFLGFAVAETTGNLVETNKIGKSFAILFQVETDSKPRKFIIYNCSCSKVKQEHKTVEDKKEVSTTTLTIKSAAEVVGDVNVFKSIAEHGNSNYDTFFTTAPTLPTFAD